MIDLLSNKVLLVHGKVRGPRARIAACEEDAGCRSRDMARGDQGRRAADATRRSARSCSESYRRSRTTASGSRRSSARSASAATNCSASAGDRRGRAAGGGGAARDDRGQRAPGDLHRQALHQPRPGIPRPDPGGQQRPHARGREVRLPQGLQVLDLRDLVDPPGDHPRDRRPGAHHPRAGAHDRGHQQGQQSQPRSCCRNSAATRRPRRSPRAWRCRWRRSRASSRRAWSRSPSTGPIGEDEDSNLSDFIEDDERAVAGAHGRPRACSRTSCTEVLCTLTPPRGEGHPPALRPRRRHAAHPGGGRHHLQGDPRARAADRGQGAAQAAAPEPQPEAEGVRGDGLRRRRVRIRVDRSRVIAYLAASRSWAHSSAVRAAGS